MTAGFPPPVTKVRMAGTAYPAVPALFLTMLTSPSFLFSEVFVTGELSDPHSDLLHSFQIRV